MAYLLQGKLLEVCTCRVVCPCWVGEDPDGGMCEGTMAWHIEKGQVEGLDVSGITIGMLAHIPGNVLNGNWRATVFIDQRATQQQQDALLAVFSGKKGGVVADMAKLVGEIVGVERVSFVFEVEKGRGNLKMGDAVEATGLTPFAGPGDRPTTLADSIFSNIPGSPAYVGKATRYRARSKVLGIDVDLRGHNSIQGEFRFEA